MNRGEFQQKIAEKALREPDFRKKLIANPKAAIQECFPEVTPSLLEKINVKIYEEKPGEFMLSIPPVVKQQITDEQLAKMSGGCDDTATAVITGILATTPAF